MKSRNCRLARLLPAVMVGLLVAPELIWIARDHSVWGWDQAEYGSTSIALYATLRLHAQDWVHALVHVLPWKSPGTTWIGQFFVPLHGLAGSYERAMLLSIAATQAASLTLVFAAARRLGATFAASAAGVIALAGAPLFVVMGRNYFVEPLQTLAVAWALFVMASATRWRPALTLAQLVAVVALGLLAKISSPIYMAAPCAAALYLAFGARRKYPTIAPFWRDWRVLSSGAIAGLLALGTAGWYRLNLDATLTHAHKSAVSTVWGEKAGFATKLVGWLHRLADAMFVPVLGPLVVAALVLGLLIALRQGRLKLDRTPERLGATVQTVLPYAACAAAVVLAIAVLSLNVTDEVRFVTPLLVCVSLLIAGLISAAGSRAVTVAVLLLLALQFGIANFKSQSFDPARPHYLWLRGARHDTKPATQLHALAQLTCTSDAGGRLTVVVPRFGWFHATALELAAKEDYALSNRHCFYAWPRARGRGARWVWSEIERLDPLYLISLDYGNPRNPLPRQTEPASDSKHRLKSGPEVFRLIRASDRFTVVPGSRRGGFVVLRARPARNESGT